MLNKAEETEIKKISELFLRYINDGTIQYMNFNRDVLANNAYEIKQKREMKTRDMLIWFTAFNSYIDLFESDFSVNKLHQESNDNKKSLEELIKVRNAIHWLSGQQANLTKRNMLPYQFVLLSLCGYSFKKNSEKQTTAYNYMVEEVRHSAVLRDYCYVDGDGELHWQIPEGESEKVAEDENSSKGKAFKLFSHFKGLRHSKNG